MIRESLNAIFVMRKEQGFGEAYANLRTGEWEYVAYRPDKSFQTAPAATASCASCHSASNKDRDWTMRAWDLPFTTAQWAQAPLPGANEVSLNRMAFFPNALTVRTGTTVKWTNTGNAQHTTTSDAATPVWSSGSVSPPGTTTCPSPPDPNSPCTPSATPGGNFQQTFTTAGTYQYHCDFHKAQGMTGTITVTP